ncbi:McrC family protein [Paenarthrobacter sp. DKR-5]|uniref:McrC family protein n=1 Tax=Paenarthrobacter sp. DKR-5 TaxID=2835535 RepID=UPI001BDD1A19|nr:McrC family protein [Paenarthrobacter sp. DKR-5]MBT1002220.1 McrC family protein [Paenarthrobacter sp. DKR-5]
MRIELAEWESAGDLDLSPAVIQQLARSSAFRIGPDPAHPNRWTLSAKQHVGITCIDDLEVRVRPKVRPDRLIELLVTSLDRIAWDHRDVAWAASDELIATIAGAFLATAERALNGGILQGYLTEEADLYAVRGRINLSRQIARNPGLPLPIAVTYDEYTTDILENQLLAGAGRLLLRLPGLTSSLQLQLRRLEYRLLEVTPIRPSPTPPSVQWTRLNLRYRPAVTLARIILKWGALDFEDEGSTNAAAFIVDMNQVFEDVVGHGIRGALGSTLTVDLQVGDYLDAHRQVPIRPDIVIRDGSRVIAVADVKYKQVAQKGVSSDDVFQAVAYATRHGLPECTLVYPERPPIGRLEVGNVTISLAAIELNQAHAQRTASIRALADRLKRASLLRSGSSSAQ